jgi:hypothetical protein
MSISAALEALKRQDEPPEPVPVADDVQPTTPPAGWSDRLGRITLEPVPGRPDRWREPEASAALCTRCNEPLAEGDLLSCEQHRQTVGVTAPADRTSVAVTQAPMIGLHDLLSLAERRDWEALSFKPGERAGGSEEAWRTFAEWARGETLRLVIAVIWERWRDTVEQYGQVAAPVAPGGTEAA